MEVKYSLRLFGGLAICSRTGGDIPLPSGRPSELLSRLVLASDAGCSRSELAEEFWPDSNPEQARHRLRQTLIELRRILQDAGFASESVIQADRNRIRICEPFRYSDVAAFDTALQTGDKRLALSLYRADLMPDCDTATLIGERERLRLKYLTVLRSITAENEQGDDLSGALDAAARLAALEPEDEDNCLLLIRLLLRAGAVESARRRYRQLRRGAGAGGGAGVGGGAGLSVESRRQVRQWFADARRRNAVSTAARTGSSDAPAKSYDLPLTRTRFFGRESELAELDRLLSQRAGRLVTLVGPAGVGKTRLALEAAARTRNLRPLFVPLAEIDDARLIGAKTLESLHLPRKPQLSPLDQAIEILSDLGSPVLLILDNLEHLVGQSATIQTVRALLQRVPRLVCLTTSRQALDAEGAQSLYIGPLPIPSAEVKETLEALLGAAGSALFIDRMQTVRPDFRATARNAHSIVSLCRHLDGLPLALEIAATWARTLTPTEMDVHLKTAERRRPLLTSRQQSATPRHDSLQAALAWSYSRLPADLQIFYARLHVFQGSFTEAACAAVCEAPNAMEQLALLEDRSFVVAFESEERMRYRLLETLREYGREQLDESEQEGCMRRHARYYLAFAEEQQHGVSGRERNEALQREIDNLRAALEASEQHAVGDEADVLPRLALALKWFWILRGYRSEGQPWMECAARLFPPVDDALRSEMHDPRRLDLQAAVLQGLASLLENQSESSRIYDLHKSARDLYHRSGNTKEEAQALNFLGSISLQSGRYPEAHGWMQRCLALCAARHDPTNTAVAMHYLGMIHDQWCEYDEADRLYGEAAEIYGAKTNPAVRTSQAITAWHRGDLDRAHRLFLEARRLRHEQGFLSAESFCLTALANIASMRGESAASIEQHNAAVAMIVESEEPRAFAMAIGYRGIVYLRGGDYASAATDLAHALRLRRACADRWGIAHALEYLGDLAGLAHADWAAALPLWIEAAAIRADLGSPIPPVERPEHDACQTQARAALGSEAFDTLWRTAISL